MSKLILPNRFNRSNRPTSKVHIPTRIRLWEVDDINYPEFTGKKWNELIKKGDRRTALKIDKHNLIMSVALAYFPALVTGLLTPGYGVWYRQALGTGFGDVTGDQTDLYSELVRRGFTENLSSDNVAISNTFFTGTDFQSASSKVDGGHAITALTFTVLPHAGTYPSPPYPIDFVPPAFRVGDIIRVGLDTGYEYPVITAVSGTYSAGQTITVAVDALSKAPSALDTVDQVIDEAALYGNPQANYTTGTVGVTNGSPNIVGTGTAWAAVALPGDKICFPVDDPRTFYTILSVTNDTHIVLTAPYGGATVAGKAYFFRGQKFNGINGLGYVKTLRGFVYENQWDFEQATD